MAAAQTSYAAHKKDYRYRPRNYGHLATKSCRNIIKLSDAKIVYSLSNYRIYVCFLNGSRPLEMRIIPDAGNDKHKYLHLSRFIPNGKPSITELFRRLISSAWNERSSRPPDRCRRSWIPAPPFPRGIHRHPAPPFMRRSQKDPLVPYGDTGAFEQVDWIWYDC